MHHHLPHYSKSSISRARSLRRNMTDAERKLWSLLRSNQLGVKFRRQVPFGKYILDFYCVKARVAVELDGSQHLKEDGLRKDRIRDSYLQINDVKVLRFSNMDMLKNPDAVLQVIADETLARSSRDTITESSLASKKQYPEISI